MNSWLFVIILKTMPRTDVNSFDESRLILKPRKEWKADIFFNILIFIISFFAFFLTEKIRVPYLGTFLFIGGFYGIFHGLVFSIRAYLVYKNYDDLFREEDVRKIDRH